MSLSALLQASIHLKCTIAVATAAFIIHLIGVATPSWAVNQYGHEGLYVSTFTYSIVAITSSVFTGLGAIICYSLYSSYWTTSAGLRRVSWTLSFCAASFTVLGAAVYGIVTSEVRDNYSLGYSYGFTLFAGLLHIVPIVLVELDRRQKVSSGTLME